MAFDVIVIGGGIAGLSAAFELQRSGAEVLVLEADAVAGGHVRTEDLDGFLLERGPHGFPATADAVFELVEDLRLGGQLVASGPSTKLRLIARDGRLHRLPTGPWSLITSSLLSWQAKWALLTEPLRRRRGQLDETAQQFFEQHLGPEATRVLASAYISGVLAGDPSLLSAPAAFPVCWSLTQETGSMVRGALRRQLRRRAAPREKQQGASPHHSTLWSLRGGTGELTRALASALQDRCRTLSPVRRLQRTGSGFSVHTDEAEMHAPQVVVATPPPAAAHIVHALDAELSQLLTEIPMAPVAVTYLGYARRQDVVPDSFGFLAPRGEGLRTLGMLFPSRLFEDRAPPEGDLLVGYVGGSLDPGILELDRAEIARVVRGDLAVLSEVTERPSLQQVELHRGAIPQLVQGHLDRVARIRQRLGTQPGLQLAGSYLYGVSMNDAVRSGLEAAQAARSLREAWQASGAASSLSGAEPGEDRGTGVQEAGAD